MVIPHLGDLRLPSTFPWLQACCQRRAPTKQRFLRASRGAAQQQQQSEQPREVAADAKEDGLGVVLGVMMWCKWTNYIHLWVIY